MLDARISALELSVARQDGITDVMLTANRPGGAENRDTSATGALAYLCWLHRQHAQGPTQQVSNAGVGRWDARGMDDLRAAMAAEPIYVTLECGRQVGVYPKSFHALNRVVDNQMAMEWVTTKRLVLLSLEAHTPDTLDTLRKATDAECRMVAEFVAIITHPGPDVPWVDDGRWDHDVDAWTRTDISPMDLLALRRAYVDVNMLRVNAIAERTRQYASGPSETMPLAAFLGVMAGEMHTRPEEIARRYSLGEVFATSLSKFEAYERAKAKADANKPPTPGR